MNFKITRRKEKKIVWNQTLNTFNQKLKKNSISIFCVTKKLMFTNICVCVYQMDIYWNENGNNSLNNEIF
jgi:hypothetical protein